MEHINAKNDWDEVFYFNEWHTSVKLSSVTIQYLGGEPVQNHPQLPESGPEGFGAPVNEWIGDYDNFSCENGRYNELCLKYEWQTVGNHGESIIPIGRFLNRDNNFTYVFRDLHSSEKTNHTISLVTNDKDDRGDNKGEFLVEIAATVTSKDETAIHNRNIVPL